VSTRVPCRVSACAAARHVRFGAGRVKSSGSKALVAVAFLVAAGGAVAASDPAWDVPLGQEAWGVENPRGVQDPSATGDAAAALIRELDARGLCDATSCKAGAIACYWNRHDESDGHVGIYTCRTSRKPFPVTAP